MQNVPKDTGADESRLEKVNVQHDIGNIISTTPQSSSSTPSKSESETYSKNRRFMSESSESEEDSVSEVESFMVEQEFEDEPQTDSAKFLLDPEDRNVDPETQARLEALLQAAVPGGSNGNLSPRPAPQGGAAATQPHQEKTSLVEACTDGDVGTVKKLLTEGRSVHETSEEGESLLSLACSAGYFELAQVLLAMQANVEDRGVKGECTPLMEASSAGHLDIVRLLVHHHADVNAQSTSGNTPLMYACAGGHTEVVKFLLENGANVEDHNENGHTPLMEAASAGHVGLAKILLMNGAGINTHSNEFKESALTLACYKGHLDMVRFLLEAGADQEHKTDEMHTALMEASMDGHVEVARLLLDSGAQVNMPTDSFESPLTLAACGGHVELALLLIERGANIEEVNDEGYTPLMEAAREGHEEMVHLLLGQGANINSQTDETQETALTLACCGGFTEVADILLKGGADIELGASTPLMEASQEGHLELVRFLLEYGANVNAVTQTNDTALTYACENGHTDVAELLIQYGADIEHESEGGRTPLMKACRAGHLCTVKFLIDKGANVRKQTTNNDHTPLSLACAGGHLSVVQLLLENNADPNHKLKDNSTMLIEAAKGGHTNVVQLLLDYPHSMLYTTQQQLLEQQAQGAAVVAAATATTNLAMLPGQVGGGPRNNCPAGAATMTPPMSTSTGSFFQPTNAVLQEVPEAVHIAPQLDIDTSIEFNPKRKVQQGNQPNVDPTQQLKAPKPFSLNRSMGEMVDGTLTSAEAQQVRTPPLSDFEEGVMCATAAMELLKEDPTSITNSNLMDFIKKRKQFSDSDGNTQKQQILEELHRVERELHGKQQLAQQAAAVQQQQQAAAAAVAATHLFQYKLPQDVSQTTTVQPNALAPVINFDLGLQQQKQGIGYNTVVGATQTQLPFYAGIGGQITPSATPQFSAGATQVQGQQSNASPAFFFSPMANSTSVGVSLNTSSASLANGGVLTQAASPTVTPLVPASALTTQPIKFQSVADVSQNTYANTNDRPKVKPIKKEAKNIRKQQLAAHQHAQSGNASTVNQLQQPQINGSTNAKAFNMFASDQQVSMFRQLQMPQQPSQPQHRDGQEPVVQFQKLEDSAATEVLNVQDVDVTFLKEDQQDSLFTASILQQFQSPSLCNISHLRPAIVGPTEKPRLELYDPQQQQQQQDQNPNDTGQVAKLDLIDKDFCDDVIQTLEMPGGLAALTAGAKLQAKYTGKTPVDLSRLEYFAAPAGTAAAPGATGQVPVPALYPYEHYLQGFQHGYSLKQQQLDSLTVGAGNTVAQPLASQSQTFVATQPQPCVTTAQQAQPVTACGHVTQGTHVCQPCSQHRQQNVQSQPAQIANSQQNSNQVQAATQTHTQSVDGKKAAKGPDGKPKQKGRVVRHQAPAQGIFTQEQNYQIDHNSAITQYSGNAAVAAAAAAAAVAATQQQQQQQSQQQQQRCAATNSIISPCMDVDSETESNHDTALTLACAGGHEELVELLISRGADIEHRDKKGFTPLILAATAGHEKVVEILLNHNADIEAQSERTKDTPLSLACSGGRYEVVELLLNRNANKEHRNVSDYTPLSLAASGGYVNIIKLLLSHGAEINSRTGSKLGISPLMLAAMNGHSAAVKLLLDMGSDINAQIETNRNTALTLACFQGRHEVVALLLDRKANVEHRAKTGLTPLMEAASGGYVDVGRVLLDKGADVNATPVPSSRDTALTIAADKGHVKFVELLLDRGAQVEVKNKKGNSPLWLAANGGHLPVIEMLYAHNADIDSQDNRKVSCLMAAFRKGHVRVAKWMVHHVTQFPSDQEMMRYIATISDKELLEKCHECVKIIRAAKETQAAKANKNASILLEELESERTREESKRLQAAKRRERKKKKRLEKKEQHKKLLEENQKNETYDDVKKEDNKEESEDVVTEVSPASGNDKEEGDSGIDANSQGSCSSNDIKAPKEKRKNKSKKKGKEKEVDKKDEVTPPSKTTTKSSSTKESQDNKPESKDSENKEPKTPTKAANRKTTIHTYFPSADKSPKMNFEVMTKSPADRDDFEATGNENYTASTTFKHKKYTEDTHTPLPKTTSPKQASKREEGWKEVVRKSSVQTVSESGVKKVSVPLNAISRVIGRGGSNINAIRQSTGALIEVEKQNKGQGERIITIKGTPDITKQAHSLITTLIKDPEVDIMSLLPKTPKVANSTTTLWDKTQIATKKNTGKLTASSSSHPKTVPAVTPTVQPPQSRASASTVKFTARQTVPVSTAACRVGPRLLMQSDKIVTQTRTATTSVAPRPPVAKIITTTASQTFAAKLTETASTTITKPRTTLPAPVGGNMNVAPSVSPQPPLTANIQNSPSKSVPISAPPPAVQLQQQQQQSNVNKIQTQSAVYGAQPSVSMMPSEIVVTTSATVSNIPQNVQSVSAQHQQQQEELQQHHAPVQPTSEYTLFCTNYWDQEQQKLPNFASTASHKFMDQEPPPQVDVTKAPGYRGGAVCSPVSSKASSNSTTPPNLAFPTYQEPSKPQQNALPPPIARPPQGNPDFSPYIDFNKATNNTVGNPLASNLTPLMSLSNEAQMIHNFNMSSMNFSQPQSQIGQVAQPASASRLNPKAPEYSSVYSSMQNKNNASAMYNGYPVNVPNNMFAANKGAMEVGNMVYNRNPNMGGNSSQTRSWMGVPQPPIFNQPPTELIGLGLAGMTIQKMCEGLDNGAELAGIVNNSPNMSPNNMPQHVMDPSHYGGEERKPQPIGTERARKAYSNPVDQNWSVIDKPAKWSGAGAEFSMRPPAMYPEDVVPIDFPRPFQVDNFTNGPGYYQQLPMPNLRQQDFIPDMSKLDISWDSTRPLNDLQDKHSWTNQWNK